MIEKVNFNHIIAVHGTVAKRLDSDELYLLKDDGEEVILFSESLKPVLEQSIGTKLIVSGKCTKNDSGIILNVDHYEKLKSAA